MSSAAAWEDDEHELVNDDGFVFKRRKRRRLEEEAEKQLLLSTRPVVSAADLERNRKQRRRTAFGKVKERYEQEILHWEILSNSLNAMVEKAPQPQQSAQPMDFEESELGIRPRFESQLDELLTQVEAQEAVLKDVSRLCDAAEAVCLAEEARRKQPFFQLPVWETPQRIFAALCEEDNCNDNADDT